MYMSKTFMFLWQKHKAFLRSTALIPGLTFKKDARQTNKTLHTLISYNYEEACNQSSNLQMM